METFKVFQKFHFLLVDIEFSTKVFTIMYKDGSNKIR